jgi:hypothetical protein
MTRRISFAAARWDLDRSVSILRQSLKATAARWSSLGRRTSATMSDGVKIGEFGRGALIAMRP